jgi:S1-C subfamily serine protease
MFNLKRLFQTFALPGAIVVLSGCALLTPPAATPTPTATPTAIPGAPVSEIADPTPTPPPPLITGLPDIASVVDQVIASVVSVLVTTEQRDQFGRTTQGLARGSGVIFDGAGYILTNSHVVEDGVKVEVVMTDGRRLEVEVVGRDPSTDLAVLKLEDDAVPNIVATKLGDTNAMRIGEWVIAIGNPLGLEGSVTVGVVSAKGRTLQLSQTVTLHDLVQTDAVINPGNSGGPLLNLRGEVVGINTAIIRGQLSSGQEAEGIGFAISMNTAIPVSRQLIENGKVIWPWLGVSVADVTPVVAAERDLSVDAGVLVVAAVDGGPADKAGIREGDVIVALNNEPVTTVLELQASLRQQYNVGDSVAVTVVRGDDERTIDVTLEEMPR